ncbi:MAG: hypothetical protein HYY93_16870, partial [Planctomycetes bacterium]|nr:hypothetical protein [Planctomycetota bacterium]
SLAEEMCDRIERDSKIAKSEKDKLDGLRAALLKSKIDVERDPVKKDTLIDQAIVKYRNAVKAGPDDAKAKFDLGDLLVMKGRNLTSAIDRETDSKKVGELRASAATVFQEAERFFEDLIRAFNAQKPSNEQKMNLIRSRYQLPVAQFFHALAYEKGKPDREKLLKDCIKNVIDFLWDYDQYIVGYELAVYQGRAYVELKDWQKAKEAFGPVIKAFDQLEGLPDDSARRLTSIILQAYYYQAMAYNEMRTNDGWKAVIELVDDMVNTFTPKVFNLEGTRDLARAAQLEKAKAYHDLGDTGKAVGLALEVSEMKPESFYTFKAKELISGWGGRVGKVAPNILLSMIEGSKSQGNWLAVAALGRRLVRASAADKEEAKWASLGWMNVGLGYQSLLRWYEAAIAFEIVYRKYRSRPEAAEAAYRCAQCFSKMKAISASEFDKNHYLEALKALSSPEFKDSPYQNNAQLIVAESKEDAGDYLPAAQDYLSIPKGAEVYETALSRVGRCYFLHAEKQWKAGRKEADEAKKKSLQDEAMKYFPEAERQLLSYIDFTVKDQTINTDLLARRRELVFMCKYYILKIYLHEAVARQKDALKVTEEIDKVYDSDKDKIVATWYYRVRAHIALKDFKSAEEAAHAFMKRFQESARALDVLQEVAAAFDAVALEKPDAPEGKEAAEKAAVWFKAWLDEALARTQPGQPSPVKAEMAGQIADKFFVLGKAAADPAKRREYFTSAESLLRKIVTGKFPGKPQSKPGEEWKWRWKWCQTLSGTERYEDAVGEYEGLCAEMARSNNSALGTLYLDLVDQYVALAKQPGTAKALKDSTLTKATELLTKLLGSLKKHDPFWWQCTYNYLVVLTLQGEYDQTGAYIGSLKMQYPNLGGEAWKQKFLDLEKSVAAKLPPK